MQEQFTGQQNTIEADLHRVGKEVREQVSGTSTSEATERALVHHSLHPMVHSSNAPVAPQHKGAGDVSLPNYMQNAPEVLKERVERLVEDAFAHGVEHAAREAQKEGPFVVDALHDALADVFYDELKRRKLV